jgi:hypothetical protein
VLGVFLHDQLRSDAVGIGSEAASWYILVRYATVSVHLLETVQCQYLEARGVVSSCSYGWDLDVDLPQTY